MNNSNDMNVRNSYNNQEDYYKENNLKVLNYSYYMFNKPAGCITAKSDAKYPVVMDYFKELKNANLNPVGRLDLDTEGLLLITDDGKWNNNLMKPEMHVEKRYYFWVMGDISEERRQLLESGVILKGEDKPTKPAKVEIVSRGVMTELPQYAKGKTYNKLGRNKPDTPITEGYITITEGKKRQIKRMMKTQHCCIVYLKRVSIGEVELDETLKPGEYRRLTAEEYRRLKSKSIEG